MNGHNEAARLYAESNRNRILDNVFLTRDFLLRLTEGRGDYRDIRSFLENQDNYQGVPFEDAPAAKLREAIRHGVQVVTNHYPAVPPEPGDDQKLVAQIYHAYPKLRRYPIDGRTTLSGLEAKGELDALIRAVLKIHNASLLEASAK